MFERCSNTGRWGPDDELGTLNYITPKKRIAAAELVKTGEVVSVGRDLLTKQTKTNPQPLDLRMLYSAPQRRLPHGFLLDRLPWHDRHSHGRARSLLRRWPPLQRARGRADVLRQRSEVGLRLRAEERHFHARRVARCRRGPQRSLVHA